MKSLLLGLLMCLCLANNAFALQIFKLTVHSNTVLYILCDNSPDRVEVSGKTTGNGLSVKVNGVTYGPYSKNAGTFNYVVHCELGGATGGSNFFDYLGLGWPDLEQPFFLVWGGADVDYIETGNREDTVDSGGATDVVSTLGAQDIIYLREGDDFALPGSHVDYVDGGPGLDVATQGTTGDTIVNVETINP